MFTLYSFRAGVTISIIMRMWLGRYLLRKCLQLCRCRRKGDVHAINHFNVWVHTQNFAISPWTRPAAALTPLKDIYMIMLSRRSFAVPRDLRSPFKANSFDNPFPLPQHDLLNAEGHRLLRKMPLAWVIMSPWEMS